MKTEPKDLVKKLIGNRHITIDREMSVKDVITITTALLRYVTSGQIKILMPMYSDGTIRRYITELISEKYMQTLRVKKPGKEAVYSITRKGINYAKELLGESNIENLDIYIDDTVPEIISDKTHKMYANELYLYICASLTKSFTYMPEAAIDEDGEVLYEDRTRKKLVVDGYYNVCMFNSDTNLPYDYTIYSEQDMCTQQSGALINKLQQYMDYAYTGPDSEICFSINAQNKSKRPVKRDDGGRAISETAYITIKTLMAVNGDSSYDEFMEFYNRCNIKEFLGSRRYTLINKELKAIKGTGMMSELLLHGTHNNDKTGSAGDVWYVKRRNFIRSCVLQMPHLVNLIKTGFSIRTVNNADFDGTFKYSHIELMATELGFKKDFKPVSVEDIVFSCYGNTLYVNISDDISGYVRAKCLLEKGLPDNYNMKILCSDVKDMEYFVEHVKGLKERSFPRFIKYPEMVEYIPSVTESGKFLFNAQI